MIFTRKKESRSADRLYPKEDAYIVFSPNFTKRGSIVNIGKEGLSCLYLVDKTEKENKIDRFANIRCGTFSLSDIPFKIVSDTIISEAVHGGQRTIRKRSIAFYDLNETQQQQINYFLKHHTRQPASGSLTETADTHRRPFI